MRVQASSTAPGRIRLVEEVVCDATMNGFDSHTSLVDYYDALNHTVRAMIIVDVQRDFCEGGSLAVEGGMALGYKIADCMRQYDNDRFGLYQYMIATKDFHDPDGDNGGHFKIWPPHCIQGTVGSMLHPAIADAGWTALDAVFYKGQGRPDYSGFQGKTPSLYDDIYLLDWLRARKVQEVDIVGIATDYCVEQTALDAVEFGFKVRVPRQLTVAVGGEEAKLNSIRKVYWAQGKDAELIN